MECAMRSIVKLLWVCVLLSISLSAESCGGFKLIADPLEVVARDAAFFDRTESRDGRMTVSPVLMDASVPTSDVPLPFDVATQSTLDAMAVSDRVSFNDTMLPDRMTPVDVRASPDIPPVSEMFQSAVLSPTTCHGRTLNLPNTFFQPGLAAWHFCYVTPDPHDREDGGAAPMRPASVSFQVGRGDSVSTLLPMVTASAPLTANPWTASVAVALPTNFNLPRFNVRQDPPIGLLGVLWALDGDGRGGLRERGTLRVWRVAADGQQMEVLLAELFLVCGGSRALSDMPTGNYVPQGMCPTVLMSCMPGPYHCQ